MKKLLTALLVFAACKGNSNFQTPEGIYVCQFENEFATVQDTMLLQKLNYNFYKITRHSRVSSKSKRKVITEVWKLEFDKDKNLFTAMKTGKIIIWDADKGELIFGNREYKKL